LSDILIIEDEAALAKLLTRLLAGAGYRVSVATTGEDGRAQARTIDPDLTILDLMLPDMRGEDLLTELLRDRPGCRVLVLSSVTQIAARVAVLTGGAADFPGETLRQRRTLRSDRRPDPAEQA
jgi:DNA-binding response OmpR family regulator